MYTIEYYKTKRERPVPKESGWDRKEVTDICWNIKSLTIDKEDIEHIIYDVKLVNDSHLLPLVARVRRASSYSDITSITILNNNIVNQLLIYEIINCEWMINRDKINELDGLKVARNLCKYVMRYEHTNDALLKAKAKSLLDHYMNTIMNLDKGEYKSDVEPLKLGKDLVRVRKRTTK